MRRAPFADKVFSNWRCFAWFVLFVRFANPASAQPAPVVTTQPAELVTFAGRAEISRARADWAAVRAGQLLTFNDRLRTLAQSRATLKLTDLTELRLGELSTLEVLPPAGRAPAKINFLRGLFYFFSRQPPGGAPFETPLVNGANRGTEFHLDVDEATGRTRLTVFDGEVDLTNRFGTLTLRTGEQGVVEPGQAPRKTAVIETVNVVQWWLYYPAALDPGELAFTSAEQTRLAPSLAAYRSGDLLAALELWPPDDESVSESARAYRAALLLSVGKVETAERLLGDLPAAFPPTRALRRMIAAAQLRPPRDTTPPVSASEWLAESYWLQSQTNSPRALLDALAAARAATTRAPDFGFAWVRVAELEFSFGRTAEAEAALARAQTLSPRHAQARALRGFLLSARGRFGEAEAMFDEEITLDGALGNAWLGRGLCRLRQGRLAAGRADLQTAVALEPNRSLLRSYLGKAFSAVGDNRHARAELDLAASLDPADPTPWLYAALLSRQELQINAAIRELELSLALNDNRRVYRSRLLLDQDRAVRNAQLATIYQDAGLPEVSVREAARAVSGDYANHSAHLFLADSFDALRDPKRVNLRYETAWFSERLLANLLAPVGGGSLSQHITQQEYSRFFEGNRLGLSSATEYTSHGDWREVASQFGTLDRVSYALDVEKIHQRGDAPNTTLDRIEFYTQTKLQLTPSDSVFFQTKYQDVSAGDVTQYYDPVRARPARTFSQSENPLLFAGFHHEWQPGVHTLLLAGRLESDQQVTDLAVPGLMLFDGGTNGVSNLKRLYDLEYRSRPVIYSGEANQIFDSEHCTLVIGGRFQAGDIATHNLITNVATYQPGISNQFGYPSAADMTENLVRLSGYAYYTHKFGEELHLLGGLAYDHLSFPDNFRSVPVSPGESTSERWSPKAAIIWTPDPAVTVRGVFTRSLGGVTFDESVRLEPTQLAGFNQAFRTIISESIVGSVAAPRYQTAGAALDLKLPANCYFGLQGEWLWSEVDRTIGAFDSVAANPPPNITASTTREHLDYAEQSLAATFNQLLGDEWSWGASYRLIHSRLQRQLPLIDPAVYAGAQTDESALLHRAAAQLLYNHRSGFFARGELQWFVQDNDGYASALANESVPQLNLFAGWRWRRQRGELTVGVLNLTGADYRLNPLTPFPDLPRERQFYARLKFHF
ncbi:MAG: TonB-dependent receptor [Verrucomicrobia bacterium]|nr:TonB-dependent receptor [Verrucomicrobiota bacterium]